MSAPPKPWEVGSRPILQHQQPTTSSFLGQSSGFQRPSVYLGMSGASLQQSPAPRPPPRPPGSTVPGGLQSYGASSYGYNNSYSPYGMRSSYGGMGSYGGYGSSYGGLGGYGGYSSYGSPYSSYMGMGRGGYGGYGMYGNQLPYGQGMESSFIRMAEENSRPAFQSLESMVHAFGSVSMMLESTFFAIHSSFRAVLGVAENFGRMRGMLAQVFSALTIFRAVRWAYNQLLVLLGIRKAGRSEKVWAEATADSGLAAIGGPEADAQKSSAWPIVMFMSLIMGGPYLIWKLVRSVLVNIPDQQSQEAGQESWMMGKAPCMIGKASFTYQAASADELSFSVGDVIAMAPTEKQPYQADGWLIGRKIGDASGTQITGPSPIGLVPSNHFRTLYSKAKKPSTATSPDILPVINEEPQPSTSSAPTPPSPFREAPEKALEMVSPGQPEARPEDLPKPLTSDKEDGLIQQDESALSSNSD